MIPIVVLCLSLCIAFTNGDATFEPRENLSFIVNANYKTDDAEYIGLRGNGLGLDMTKSILLKRNDDTSGQWSHEFKYKSDLEGFYCQECSSENQGYIPNREDLKIYFFIKLKDSDEEVQMVGDAFRISLPQSEVSSYFAKKPTYTFYPYFFNKEGYVEVIDVEAADEKIGKRRIILYLPPGFSENPKPEYDVFYMLDLSPRNYDWFQTEFDKVFVRGAARDSIIIGHGDWVYGNEEIPDRTLQLTTTVGDDLACNQGTMDDYCDGCIPWEATYEESLYWMLDGGCGHAIKSGGHADSNIDYLLNEVQGAVNVYLKDYSSALTDSREGTFVLGFSHGGLFACHAAWTRPEAFGGAACQSASFWYPFVFAANSRIYNDFYFVNKTLQDYQTNRLPQKILIDVGSTEEDNLFLSVSMSAQVTETLANHPMFKLNKNLWFFVYPGHEHSTEDWMRRLWNSFKLLSIDRD